MSLETYNLFKVGKVTPVLVGADTTTQKRITNASGGKLFYKTASDVDTGDTELAVGSSVTVEATNWVISETESTVLVETVAGATSQDVTVTDKATVKGELEVDGELNHDGSKVGFYGVAPAARANKLTAISGETIDATYGEQEKKVLENLKKRSEETEAVLTGVGLAKSE